MHTRTNFHRGKVDFDSQSMLKSITMRHLAELRLQIYDNIFGVSHGLRCGSGVIQYDVNYHPYLKFSNGAMKKKSYSSDEQKRPPLSSDKQLTEVKDIRRNKRSITSPKQHNKNWTRELSDSQHMSHTSIKHLKQREESDDAANVKIPSKNRPRTINSTFTSGGLMEFSSSNIHSARSTAYRILTHSKSYSSGRKRVRNRSQLPSFQQFHDKQVLLWIQNKDAMKREENRKKRAMERARREAEFAAEVERRKRAEMASDAFDRWLLRKAQDLEVRRQAAGKRSVRSAMGLETSGSVRHDESISSNSSKSIKQSAICRKTAEKQPNAKDRGEKSTSRRTCPRHQSSNPSKAEQPMCTDVIPSPQGEGSLTYRSKSPMEANEKTVETGMATELPIIPPQRVTISAQSSPIQAMAHASNMCHQDVLSMKLTHKDWLRQRYFEAEIEKQARLEARHRLALMEHLDPRLIQTWTDFFKSRCIELGKQQHLLIHEKLGADSTPNTLSRRQIERTRRTRTSLSESEASSKRSLMSCGNKSTPHRRRFYLKLPNSTMCASELQRPSTSLDYTDAMRTVSDAMLVPANGIAMTTTSSCVAAIIRCTPEWTDLDVQPEVF